jgi:hypothetical protein
MFSGDDIFTIQSTTAKERRQVNLSSDFREGNAPEVGSPLLILRLKHYLNYAKDVFYQ